MVPPEQQPKSSFEARRLSHARPNSRMTLSRTYKAGYRDTDHLWSGYLFASLEVRIGQDGAAGSPTTLRASRSWAASASRTASMVAMEATGGYEKQALPCCPPGAWLSHLQPACGAILLEPWAAGEDGPIDAGMIAWYAAVKQRVSPPGPGRAAATAGAGHPPAPTDGFADGAQRNQRRLVTDAHGAGRVQRDPDAAQEADAG